MRRVWAGVVLGVMASGDALAGKRSGEKGGDAPPAEVVGRPAGMNFVEVPCPFTVGARYSWSLVGPAAEGAWSIAVVAADDASIDLEVSGRPVARDPLLGAIDRGLAAALPPARVRWSRDTRGLEVTNTGELSAIAEKLPSIVEAAEKAAGQAMDAERKRAWLAEAEGPAMWREAPLAQVGPVTQYACGSFALGATEFRRELTVPGGYPAEMTGTVTFQRVNPTTISVAVRESLVPGSASAGARYVAGGEIGAELAAELDGLGIQVTVDATLDATTGLLQTYSRAVSRTWKGDSSSETTTVTLAP